MDYIGLRWSSVDYYIDSDDSSGGLQTAVLLIQTLAAGNSELIVVVVAPSLAAVLKTNRNYLIGENLFTGDLKA